MAVADGAVVGEPVDHEVQACGEIGVLRRERETAVFDLVIECGDDKGSAGLCSSVEVADFAACEGIDETGPERSASRSLSSPPPPPR